MFDQMTLWDTPSATSSLGLEDGPSPPASLAGPMTDPCGQPRARVSRSRLPAKGPELLMRGTFGPTFSASSVPEGPLSSWENRLRQRLARIGSSECDLTWKASAMSDGVLLSRLVPSTPRTVEIDCGLLLEAAMWVTCTTRDHKDTPGMSLERSDGRSRVDQLPRQVAATMSANSAGITFLNTLDATAARTAKARELQTAMYPTPSASGFEAADAKRLMERREQCKESTGNGNGFGLTLGQFACLESAMWPTPMAGTPAQNGNSAAGNNDSSRLTVAPAHGTVLAGSSATTAKRGVLNPAFPCWLMGYPLAHLSCGGTAMQSFRKSQRK